MTGDLTGNVTGDLTGNVTGNVTGNLVGNVTATDISASGTITANGNIVVSSLAVQNTDDNYRNIVFQGANNILHKDSKLVFNPSINTFETSNIICDTITTTGNTSIRALNNTTALASRIPFINGTESGVLVSRGNFNYNTSTETMNCGTISTTNVNSQNITTNTSTTTTATTGTTITDTLNLKAVEPTATGANCRLCFFDGAGTTGSSYNIVKSDNLYFNFTNSILVTNKIQGQIQMNSPLFVMMVPTALIGLPNATNASIGLYDHSGTVRNRYQHTGGHLFMDGNTGNNLLLTNTAQTRIYNELQCDDDVTISGTLTAGTLNVGTQTATNFSVANDLTVGGDTILSNVPTASGISALSILLLGTNKIHRGSITFNPLSNILSTTNIGLTGSLSSSIVTTTTLTTDTLSATTLNLSGDLTAGDDVFFTNLGNITTLKTYELLVKDTSDDAVKKTTGITAGVNLFGGESFLDADQIKTDTIILNGLPLNYTETYNTDTWGIVSNASFGGGNYILLPSTGTLKQYGSLLNPSGGIFGLKSASSEWGFTNSAYDGLYEINISCYFQNDGNTRVVPRLNLYRWRSGSYSQQTQLHADSSYIRMDAGKVNSIGIRGKIHLTSVDTFRIPTLINVHTSTDFADQLALFDGTDFVFSMTYLGKLTETITT